MFDPHKGLSPWAFVGRLFFCVAVWFSTAQFVMSKVVPSHSTSLFSCGEGSLEISLDYVNDDYCDCPNGSDETSTSACSHLSNSFFTCDDQEWKKVVLPSSRVGDGICDCCDGSDEQSSPSSVECPNICAAKVKEIIEQQIALKRAVQAGIEIRSSVIKEAHRRFSSWKSRPNYYS